jgi:hypothetical protein
MSARERRRRESPGQVLPSPARLFPRTPCVEQALDVTEFTLSSSAFTPGQPIPARHTCDGEDRSPPLEWSNVPAGTRALALIVDDPDAPGGTFTHWLAWGLDPEAGGVAEGEPAPAEGRNDFDVVGYRGPCPPPGTARIATSSTCLRSTPSPRSPRARAESSWSAPPVRASSLSPSSPERTSAR